MKAFIKSSLYAFHGIVTAVKTQRNLRIHIVAAIYIIGLSLFYNLSCAEYAILILAISSVISLELINTAVESTVDLCSPEYHKLAKCAKDCSAGAVLISAIGAVIIGIFLFYDIDVLICIVKYYSDNIFALSGLILSVIISIVFIAYPLKKPKRTQIERSCVSSEKHNNK